MLVYVLLLAAATPEAVYQKSETQESYKEEPYKEEPNKDCGDGSRRLVSTPCSTHDELPSAPKISEAALSEVLKTNPRPAIPMNSPGSWVSTVDYPSQAIRQEREGTSGFVLTVGTDGSVTSCSITVTSGSPDLDDATCSNIARRARFYPATDKKGRAIAASYANRVTWRIPQDSFDDYTFAENSGVAYPRFPIPTGYLQTPQAADFPVSATNAKQAGIALVALTIDELGAVSECVVSKTSGFVDLDDASCQFARSKWTFTPALDFDGKPTRGRIEKYVIWHSAEAVADASFEERPRKPNTNVFKDPGKVSLQFELNSNGQPLNCKVTTQGLETMLKQAGVNIFDICKLFSEPGMVAFEPFVDASGNAESRIVSVEIKMKHLLGVK